MNGIAQQIKGLANATDFFREVFAENCPRDSRNFLCPWHDDTDPSLQPFDDHLYCHGSCNRRYDVIDIAQRAFGLSFKEAVDFHKERLGIKEKNSPEEYIYEDAEGKPYIKVVRTVDKEFFQYRWENGKWINGLGGDKRKGIPGRKPILYRLSRLVDADEIWITEGEKDVHTLESLGFTATTAPMGAGKWRHVCEDGKPPIVLHGKKIIVCGDRDKPDPKTGKLHGQEHVEDIARSVKPFAASLRVVWVPQGKDVSDFLESVGLEEARKTLQELVASTPEYEPTPAKTDEDEPEKEKQRRPNKFKRLLAAFEETNSDVFLDEFGTGWACMEIADHHENLKLNSVAFQRRLLRLYGAQYDDGIGRETIGMVTDRLAAHADETRPLFNRFALSDGKFYIDLVTSDWSSIEIDGEGWRKVRLARPLFQRYPHQKSLPDPQAGGRVQDLLQFLALKEESAQMLLLVWLCTVPLEHIPRPGITFHGLQGSTKSTAQWIVRSLVDPSATPLLSLPKESNEFVQQMYHHAVVSIENIGTLPAWASDDLCRTVTGGGFAKRMLYTDDDDVLYSFRRTFLMNGVNVPGKRPDLLDRTILIELSRIPEEDRIEEQEVLRAFEDARPKIFGAMLEAISTAMRIRGSIELTRLPRMADWCKWGCAVAEALGIDHRRFLDAYYKSIRYQHEEIVSSEPICQALLRFMDDLPWWEGEPAALYAKLKDIGDKMDLTKEGFPKAPHTMSRKLNSLAHNLA